MSTQEQEFADHMVAKEDEAAERPFLVREFATEIVRGDGRTVDVRIVPYGEQITHHDGHGGVARGLPYREEFVRGAFDDQLRAANRVDVLMNFEHEVGIRGLIGRGTALSEQPDGLHGTFRIFDGPDGDKALTLINEGICTGVSLEALPKKNIRTRDGVLQRVKVHLRNVALTRFAAYPSAVVLAVREANLGGVIWEEELLPIEIDPEVIARCRRLGIQLPQRYQTHPAQTDTPPEGGTPGAAPVEPTVHSNTGGTD